MACAKSSPSAALYRSALAAMLLAASGPALAQPVPLGTAFTYQGRLTDAGSAADGIYDFELKLFDAASGGSQVASPRRAARSLEARCPYPAASGPFPLSPLRTRDPSTA